MPDAAEAEGVGLYLAVPLASFRVPQAREYLETLPCPPPSTVYGALLSLVGETRRATHAGAELALALLQPAPRRSVVLRTTWRVKDPAIPPGLDENRKPDYQELLCGLRLAVWVRRGQAEAALPALAERVSQALARPAAVQRFGGLSLGESTHLVDEVRELRPLDGEEGDFVVRDPGGPLALPLWPDHVGSAGTTWVQCRVERRGLAEGPAPDCWLSVHPGAA